MKKRLGRVLSTAALPVLALFACLDPSGAFLARKDTVPPEVVSVCASAVASGDAGAGGGTNCAAPLSLAPTDGVVITFSKTMDSASLFSGIAILKGSENLQLSLSFQPSDQIPESAQNVSVPYSVTVTAASGRFDAYPEYALTVSKSLADLAGNPLAKETRATFKVQ